MAAATTPRFNLCICVCHPFVLPASPMGSAFNQRITPPFSHRTGSFWGKANGHHSLSLGLVGEADIRKHHRVFGRFSSPTFLVLGQAPYQEQVDFLASLQIPRHPARPPIGPVYRLPLPFLPAFPIPGPVPMVLVGLPAIAAPAIPAPAAAAAALPVEVIDLTGAEDYLPEQALAQVRIPCMPSFPTTSCLPHHPHPIGPH